MSCGPNRPFNWSKSMHLLSSWHVRRGRRERMYPMSAWYLLRIRVWRMLSLRSRLLQFRRVYPVHLLRWGHLRCCSRIFDVFDVSGGYLHNLWVRRMQHVSRRILLPCRLHLLYELHSRHIRPSGSLTVFSLPRWLVQYCNFRRLWAMWRWLVLSTGLKPMCILRRWHICFNSRTESMPNLCSRHGKRCWRGE